MTHKRAVRIASLSESLTQELKNYANQNDGDLPEWLQAKIENAYQLILSAYEYLQGTDDLVKGSIFGSPAGKYRVSKRLASLLPEHDIYVEPFCGSGAVFLEKAPAGKKEVLNDMNAKMAEAWRILSKLTDQQLETLKNKNWRASKPLFMKLHASNPASDIEKLYRFLYVRRFSYGSWDDRGFSNSDSGKVSTIPSKIEKYLDRVRGTKVYSGDYEKVMKKYDSADTVFFLDPPYPGFVSHVDEESFDEERFFNVLKNLKGKWLLTYGAKGELPKMLRKAGYKIQKFDTDRSLHNAQGAKGSRALTNILVANYDIKKAKKVLNNG